ncbi:hypothetical protein RRF57_011808 [Xylaria bambusicola]|uniref:Uncharacterized protein n=1 Tax=Xylaria bambusicola TaxID=326684 RepID=A0AAN7ZDC1_9PEZI
MHHSRDDTANKAHLLRHIYDPVDRAANTAPILARRQEERIAEAGQPDTEKAEEEGVFATAGSQLEVLRAQGGLEDEHVEVDHRR